MSPYRLMFTIPLAWFAALAATAWGCSKEGGRRPVVDVATDSQPASAPPDAVSEAPPSGDTSAEAPLAPRAASDVASVCLPGCDMSTFEGVLAISAKLPPGGNGVSWSTHFDCGNLVPDLGPTALVGSAAFDYGCSYSLVVHDCCLYRRLEASRPVLGLLGWNAADEAGRARLARLWTDRILLVGGGIGLQTVVEEDDGDFHRSRRTFTPPVARPLPGGGVRVEEWVLFEGGRSAGRSYSLCRYDFAPDGSHGKLEILEEFVPVPPPELLQVECLRSEAESGPYSAGPLVTTAKMHALEILACRKLSPDGPFAVQGEIELQIGVDANGTTTGIEVLRNSTGVDAIATCVGDALRPADWARKMGPLKPQTMVLSFRFFPDEPPPAAGDAGP